MKRIFVASNSLNGLILFRSELIKTLLKANYKVIISAPNDVKIFPFYNKNLTILNTKFIRRSSNLTNNLKLFIKYLLLLIKYNPELTLTYTIKPNIYVGILTRFLKIKHIATVTGLGEAFQKENFKKKFLILLYRFAFKKTKIVFFQNKDNMQKFKIFKILNFKMLVVPGSGVNTNKFKCQTLNKATSRVDITFVGRIMKSKGIDTFLEQIDILSPQYSNLHFNVVGPLEENYLPRLKKLSLKANFTYHGNISNIIPIYKKSSVIVLPSFHEGLSNVLLEAASCCRPLIGTDIPGINEIIRDGVNGFLFNKNDSLSLSNVLKKFISLSILERENMGINARLKVIREFDRKFVTNTYFNEISILCKE